MQRNVAAAKECGYLKDLPPIMHEEDAAHIPRHKILYVMTGCQGEARAALMRIVLDNHRHIHITKKDTVVFSSKVIPGNERPIYRAYNFIAEKGAEIISEKDAKVHVSGHPGQDELKQMYEWIRPEIVVPTHGENVHLLKQAQFAESLGYKKTIVPKNGFVIKLAPGPASVINEVHHGRLALDGGLLVENDDIGIVERRRIMHNGALIIHLTLNDDGFLLAPVEITALGIPNDADKGLINFIDDKIHEALDIASRKHLQDDDVLKEIVRATARKASKRFSGKETGPVTKVTLSRIN
ncbi:MAG: ribonuclease J [Kordiimonadaceae bacterium]|nr:ribonuclease J [Kordiimonadaceae bacterium]